MIPVNPTIKIYSAFASAYPEAAPRWKVRHEGAVKNILRVGGAGWTVLTCAMSVEELAALRQIRKGITGHQPFYVVHPFQAPGTAVRLYVVSTEDQTNLRDFSFTRQVWVQRSDTLAAEMALEVLGGFIGKVTPPVKTGNGIFANWGRTLQLRDLPGGVKAVPESDVKPYWPVGLR